MSLLSHPAQPWVEYHARRSHDETSQSNADYIYLFDEHKRFIVQVTAVTGACASLLLVSVIFYWFIRMRKRFRHKLIMLLILGDWTRSLWYVVFAVVSFRQGTIETHTTICQAAGYLTQMGTEISDFAVLFISIHGATQIFKPPVSVAGNDDRLYRHRRWIYAFVLLVPQLFAALPFADPKYGAGYLSQGAFCTLPIRPIWYRLVLTWIPRLLIWLTILGLALAIYIHVHREFKNFSEAFRNHPTTSNSFIDGSFNDSSHSEGTEKRRDSSPGFSPYRASPEIKRPPPVEQPPAGQLPEQPAEQPRRPPPVRIRRASLVGSIDEILPVDAFAPNIVAPSGRRNSRVRIEVPTNLDGDVEAQNTGGRRKSVTDSLRSWRSSLSQPLHAVDNASDRRSFPSSIYDSDRSTPGRNSIMSLATFFNSTRRSSSGAKSAASDTGFSRTARRLTRRNSDPLDARMRQKRAHITRQLRQVFVYPMVYILIWLMPFTLLCITYNNKLAHRPPFLVNTMASFCICSIGAINAIVFSLREKPWRHIPNNPGRSFWGSFCFWRRPDGFGRSKRWSESTHGTYVESNAPLSNTGHAPPPPAASASSPHPPRSPPPLGFQSPPRSSTALVPQQHRPRPFARASLPPPILAAVVELPRRGLRRASSLASSCSGGGRGSVGGSKGSEGQRVVREMAYERLKWEREQAARTGSGGRARRGSTGGIGAADGGLRGTVPGTGMTKEWWEKRGGGGRGKGRGDGKEEGA